MIHHGLVEYDNTKLCNFGERKKWINNREVNNMDYLNEHRQYVKKLMSRILRMSDL